MRHNNDKHMMWYHFFSYSQNIFWRNFLYCSWEKQQRKKVQEMKTNKHVLSNQIATAGFSQRAENWIISPTSIFLWTSSQQVEQTAFCWAHSNFQLDIKSWQQGVHCKSDRPRIINLHTVAFILIQGNTNISFSDNNMATLPCSRYSGWKTQENICHSVCGTQ